VVIDFQVSPGTGILSTATLSRPTAQRMMVFDQRTQLFGYDVGVNLCGCNIGVAQHELDAAQICPRLE
jgi:hypothetical protein